MRPRHAVLLTPSKSSHPTQLLYRQSFVRVSPLDATLMVSPASVANKRLTAWLSPLDATLTKKTGGGYANSSHFGTHPSLLTALIPVLSFHALTGTPFCNSLLLMVFHVMGGVPTSRRSNVPTFRRAFLPPATLSPHGSPTSRPTFPRRSPLARGDRSRHPRFTALHCAPRRRRAFFASPDSSGSTLLDRNWFRAR